MNHRPDSPRRERQESRIMTLRSSRIVARVSRKSRVAALLLVLAWLPAFAQQAPSLAELHRQFAHPPDSSRIMMRWWWFGPAATEPEITKELEQMKAAGIGGVEIANLYALALDDPQTGFHNTAYLSDEHLDALRFADEEARRLGMRIDITLCSGWPFGGPHIPVTQAAGKLRVEAIPVPAGVMRVQAPFIDQGEQLISAFTVPALDAAGGFSAEARTNPSRVKPVDPPVDGWYSLSPDEGRTLMVFISSRSGMTVKRPSVGAGGFVLDHYDRAAIETHLHAVGERLLSAFGDHPPYAVFSDSLEDYGSDWTPALLDEFQRRRGYDLRPHLPALVLDMGPETAAIRHDWGRTLTELADENYLVPIHDWAQAHHTLFRSQTYGYPPVTLSSNKFADLPEGEGKATFMMGREFSDTRWAASAGHLFHRPVISSETWTWLHSPAFRATPLDLKAEADLHFLQGINQLVGHGWPYSPAQAGEPGWRMYAAAALDAHNPWFFAMPELTAYLERVSFALRQGEPANDVALLLPNDDVWAGFKAGLAKHASPTSPGGFDETGSNVSIDESMDQYLGKRVIAQILDAGFNLDFIDADAIDSVGIPYRVLVLPDIDRLPVVTCQKVLAFARHGGVVIATRRMPATAPGLMQAAEDSARLKEISHELLQSGIATAAFVEDESELGIALRKLARPDMTLTPPTPEIGFVHRKVKSGDLYFVVNTSNVPKMVQAKFRDSAKKAEVWDAFTGEVTSIADPSNIDLQLAPYESKLIFFSDLAASSVPQAARREKPIEDLTRDWKIMFGNKGTSMNMDSLKSWAEYPETRFYSGRATYEKTFELEAGTLNTDAKILLDFGKSTPEPLPNPPGGNNMKAYLDAPIRDAAEVFVNGQRAGAVWHPPYRIDVTKFVREGSNDLRIVVGNTAINELAGHALPDYRLLWERYGKLFEPQGMQNLAPLPSGILGAVTVIQSTPAN
jgi:glycosyl hydrolase family 106( putative alpha-L-rhamnosidase)